jgi:hypothetical protein
VAKVILGVALLYVGGINLLVATPLFQRAINADPLMLYIRYDRGWSLLPGRIHAHGLTIRGRDTNVEWILRIDDVVFDVSLPGLLRRRFEAWRVRGTGVSLRVRGRVDAWSVTSDALRDLPPIEGLRSDPIRPFNQETMNIWSDADYNLWTVILRDVVAEDVREVWVDKERFRGSATVLGGFHLVPLRSATIGPIRAEIHRGAESIGALPWIDRVTGTADVRIDSFDPRRVPGGQVGRLASVAVGVTGYLPDVARLPILSHAPARLSGSAALRRLDLEVRDGALRSPGRLELASSDVRAAMGMHRVDGALHLSAAIAPSQGSDRLTFQAELTDAAMDDGLLRAARVTAVGDAGALDVARLAADVHVVVESPDVELADARRLVELLGPEPPVVPIGGSAHVAARLEAWPWEPSAMASASVHGEALALRAGGVRLQSRGLEAEVAARVEREIDGDTWTAAATATVRARRLAIEGGGIPPVVLSSPIPTAQARASLSAAFGSGAARWLVPDAAARGADLGAHGAYGASGGHRRGAFVVEKGPLSIGLRIDDDGVHLRLFDLDDWLQRERGAAMRQGGALQAP